MIRFLALLLLICGPASAETARVISGEHADFTRLVVELPQATDWTLGRTAMGYAFATRTASQPAYDLSRVWDRIPRSRLQALRVDPETGVLQLALACRCHVFPFDYQPGMVVLDIRDGDPPPGSAFEAAFDPTPVGQVATEEPAASTGFDWVRLARAAGTGPRRDHAPAFDAGSPSLDPLRDELLEQISRGAADGVIDMQLPGRPPKVAEAKADLPWAQVRIGEIPGVEVIDPKRPEKALRPDGGPCLPDERLAVGDWGGGRRPLDILAEARSGLYGEFDAVVPEAVLRAVRQHLYLGFGAEALQYAALLPDRSEDLDILLSMARLIEGDADPSTPFAPMLGCDTAAAFWAALAHDRLPAGSEVNTDAIVRAFLALPPHLRLHLGDRLATRLLPRDADAARMVRDAIERTPHVTEGAVALLDAKAELRGEHPETALPHAEAALSQGRSGPDALVALVEAHFQASEPLAPAVTEELMAFRAETGARPDLDRAVVLALALSGQIDQALALERPATVEADLWSVIARHARDDTLLRHAVLPEGATRPDVSDATGLAVATRLLALGFPDSARVWVGAIGPQDSADRKLVAAEAELARGDARQALSLLSGVSGPEADALRARARTQLGDLDGARQSLNAAGDTEAARRLAVWGRDWEDLEQGGSDAWARAAPYASAPVAADLGPLARGAALLEDSAAAREALAALLASVPPPAP